MTIPELAVIVVGGPRQAAENMARSALFEAEKPLFSGHETFPVRYGWLKKAFDAVDSGRPSNRSTFTDDSAIASFGVGKNMVASIRHWAISCGVIEEDAVGNFQRTALGNFIFGPSGVDPYLENPASLWLLHWNLCNGDAARSTKTTWYWVFNHFSGTTFRREDLLDGLLKLAENRGWTRVSRTTVQRDVECFVRTYASRATGSGGASEDSLESPLAELGLIRTLRGHFQLVRGPKRSLPLEIFAYSLDSFWRRTAPNTLSFEAVAHEPGSPGRVFMLDEGDLADRLLEIEELTDGAMRWSETAGLKQVIRSRQLTDVESMDLLREAYNVLDRGPA